MSKISVYDNIAVNLAAGVLTIKCTVDENQVEAQPSKSGKSMVFATTGGAQRVDGSPFKVNLTVYQPVQGGAKT
jgi:hypothetical protein